MHTSPPEKNSSNLHESQELSGPLLKKTEISQNTENFHSCNCDAIVVNLSSFWLTIKQQ